MQELTGICIRMTMSGSSCSKSALYQIPIKPMDADGSQPVILMYFAKFPHPLPFHICNGDADLAEFLSSVLVQKVDKEYIDEIKALFNKFRVDKSGTISKNDLIIMTTEAVFDVMRVSSILIW
eukprot:8471922-Ditylum_brightwellii.AAC.1